MVETIIFAMVAAFLGLRLYAVLGRRDGHEQSLGKPAEEPLAVPKPATVAEEQREPATIAAPQPEVGDPRVNAGLRAISSADPRFSAGDFVEGATGAYRMILESYWSGDDATLRPLVADDVFATFSDAIAARKAAGEVLDNRLVAIERAVISQAELDGRVARITVRFDADIAAVTRDSEGRVVAGSLTDAVPTHDVWTFERDLKSADPNWMLTDTDEAA